MNVINLSECIVILLKQGCNLCNRPASFPTELQDLLLLHFFSHPLGNFGLDLELKVVND